MTSAGNALQIARRWLELASLKRLVASPRLYIYLSCTLLAAMTSYHMGKDTASDTLNYHLYLGFSGLHNRFGQDYFPAGPQAYLNPYALVPFYLLATSGLTALQAASIFAVIQSAILWVTYELAMVVAPNEGSRQRLAFGICAAALAFVNPVLISQFGSSFTDITTAEVVLCGWLLLARAVHTPSAFRVAFAGLLIGGATALKLTNSLDAISASAFLIFLPMGWGGRFRQAALFCAAVGIGFVVLSVPWAIHLEEHFGNPVFPLLNGLFRSPDYFTAPVIPYCFVPTSLGAALIRPFEMVLPRSLIQVEEAAPDARYALLLVLAILFLVAYACKYLRRGDLRTVRREGASSARVLAALSCGFLVDWVLWLAISGNGRYFIPMACVAAVLCVALTFRLFSARPRVRNYLLAGVLLVQAFQLHAGTQYLEKVPWKNRPWFDVSVPRPLASQAALYFNIGVQSYAFLAPYLAPGSGLVNLQGDYTLGPGGANGAHVEALIRKYSPHMRILVRDIREDAARRHDLFDVENVDDALAPFGLHVSPSRCSKIVVHGILPPTTSIRTPSLRDLPSELDDGYFVSCAVIAGSTQGPGIIARAAAANRALDHLEDACPALFQPARPASFLRGDKRRAYWMRRYDDTGIGAWVLRGQVQFRANLGGPVIIAGSESAWEKAALRVDCGRTADGYFFSEGSKFATGAAASPQANAR